MSDRSRDMTSDPHPIYASTNLALDRIKANIALLDQPQISLAPAKTNGFLIQPHGEGQLIGLSSRHDMCCIVAEQEVYDTLQV